MNFKVDILFKFVLLWIIKEVCDVQCDIDIVMRVGKMEKCGNIIWFLFLKEMFL